MGDMPINLSSPDDRSKLLFSRSINNKKNWIKTFNLGYEVRGNTKKPKRRAYMTEAQFKRAVVNNTTVQQKSEAQKCTPCNGYGKVAKKRHTVFRDDNGNIYNDGNILREAVNDNIGNKFELNNTIKPFQYIALIQLATLLQAQGTRNDRD